MIGVGVHNLTLDLVCPTSVVSQAAGSSSDITLGHAEGLSVVQRLNSGEEVGVLVEEVGKLVKELATVTGGNLPPHFLEALAGSCYCDVDILLSGLLNLADDLLVGGVDDIELLAVDGIDELSVDEETGGLLVLAGGRGLDRYGAHDCGCVYIWVWV